MFMSEACGGGGGLGLQANTNLDCNGKPHYTLVVFLRAHGVWVLLEHSLVFYDSKNSVENNRERERESDRDIQRAQKKKKKKK